MPSKIANNHICAALGGHRNKAYIYSSNLSVHELIFSGCSLESLTSQLHRISRIVNVRKDLNWNRCLGVLCHLVQDREMSNHVVSEECMGLTAVTCGSVRALPLHPEPNLLPTSRLVLFFSRVIYDSSTQIVKSIR